MTTKKVALGINPLTALCVLALMTFAVLLPGGNAWAQQQVPSNPGIGYAAFAQDGDDDASDVPPANLADGRIDTIRIVFNSPVRIDDNGGGNDGLPCFAVTRGGVEIPQSGVDYDSGNDTRTEVLLQLDWQNSNINPELLTGDVLQIQYQQEVDGASATVPTAGLQPQDGVVEVVNSLGPVPIRVEILDEDEAGDSVDGTASLMKVTWSEEVNDATYNENAGLAKDATGRFTIRAMVPGGTIDNDEPDDEVTYFTLTTPDPAAVRGLSLDFVTGEFAADPEEIDEESDPENLEQMFVYLPGVISSDRVPTQRTPTSARAVYPDTIVEINLLPPVPTAVETVDSNTDGRLDNLRITWSKNVALTPYNKDNVTVTADNGTIVLASGPLSYEDPANQNVTLHPLDLTNVPATGNTGDAGTMDLDTEGFVTSIEPNDANGNPVAGIQSPAGVTGIAIADRAGPVPMSAVTVDSQPDGQIDAIDVNWSENLGGNWAYDELKAQLIDGAVVLELSDSGSSVDGTDLSLTHLVVVDHGDTGVAPTFSVVDSDNSGVVTDEAGNVSPDFSISVADAVPPVAMQMFTRDYLQADGTTRRPDGTIDTVEVIFSEEIDDATFSGGATDPGADPTDPDDHTFVYGGRRVRDSVGQVHEVRSLFVEVTGFGTNGGPQNTALTGLLNAALGLVTDPVGQGSLEINNTDAPTTGIVSDGAWPAILSSDVERDVMSGKITQITFTLSEPMAASSQSQVDLDDWRLVGTDGTDFLADTGIVTLEYGPDSDMTLVRFSFDGGVGNANEGLGFYRYENDGDTDVIVDDAGNTGPMTNNARPTAVARAVNGDDSTFTTLTMDPGTVTLDGSGSNDDIDAVSDLAFAWSAMHDGGVTVDFNPDNSQTIVTSNLNRPGTYEFRLTVTDTASQNSIGGSGVDAPDIVEVVVNNLPPFAHAGPDMVVQKAAGATVVFDGKFSRDPNDGDDPADSDIETYEWVHDPEDALELDLSGFLTQDTADPQGTLDLENVPPNVYRFKLTVTDSVTDTAEDFMYLVVLGESLDTVPSADAGPDFLASQDGGNVTIEGGASRDPSGNNLTYTWTQVSGPSDVTVPAPSNNSQLTFNPGNNVGVYTFDLRVDNGVARSMTDRVSVVVPAAARVASADQTVNGLFTPVTLNAAQTNGNGVFVWEQVGGPSVTLLNASTASPSFVPILPGLYAFDVYAVSENNSLPQRVYVKVQNGNAFPTADAGADQSVTFDGTATPPSVTVTLDGSASSDPDGDSLTHHWMQVGGPWVALDTTNPAQPMFDASNVGVYRFELRVDDGSLLGIADSVTVVVDDTDPQNTQAIVPTADAGPDINAAVSTVVNLDGTASIGGDGEATLTYRWFQPIGTYQELTQPLAVNPSFTAPSTAAVFQFDLYVFDGLSWSPLDLNLSRMVVTVTDNTGTGPNPPASIGGIVRSASGGSSCWIDSASGQSLFGLLLMASAAFLIAVVRYARRVF